MTKKEEIESLKNEITKLRKLNLEFNKKLFDDDINNVCEILKRHGTLVWRIENQRNDFFGTLSKKITFELEVELNYE